MPAAAKAIKCDRHRNRVDVEMRQANSLDAYVDAEYHAMRSQAQRVMRQFQGAFTLQPTAVVHEALIKIWGKSTQPTSRKDFMLAISGAMRDVLIDNLRQRLSAKRGAGSRAKTLLADVPASSRTLVANRTRVNDAMEELYSSYPRAASVVDMRFFGGFSLREIASELRVSLATVERDAAKGRAILFAILSDD